MKTFEASEVREFTWQLCSQMDRCDSSGGLECANLDATLHLYANACSEFLEKIRKWV